MVISQLKSINVANEVVEYASDSFLAHKECLAFAFESIDSKYGNFRNFLEELNIDEHSIQKLLYLYAE